MSQVILTARDLGRVLPRDLQRIMARGGLVARRRMAIELAPHLAKATPVAPPTSRHPGYLRSSMVVSAGEPEDFSGSAVPAPGIISAIEAEAGLSGMGEKDSAFITWSASDDGGVTSYAQAALLGRQLNIRGWPVGSKQLPEGIEAKTHEIAAQVMPQVAAKFAVDLEQAL